MIPNECVLTIPHKSSSCSIEEVDAMFDNMEPRDFELLNLQTEGREPGRCTNYFAKIKNQTAPQVIRSDKILHSYLDSKAIL